jgi:type 1 glutamine amidotransferase
MPVAWTKKWGKGRVYYLALGHRSDAWHEADGCKQEFFKVLLTRGIVWVSKNNKNTEARA